MAHKSDRLISLFFLILIILVPFVLTLFVTLLLSFNPVYHEFMVERHSVVENKSSLDKEVLEFLAGGDTLPDMTVDEKSHMYEVRRVFRSFQFLFFFFFLVSSVLFIFLYRLHKKKFLSSFFLYAGVSTIMFQLILLVCGLFFSFSFDLFHRILFRGVWQFPADQLLVSLYPYDFFRETFFIIILVNLIIGGIFLKRPGV
ncbi:MAG: DUF1461 domain-containing protein [Candidatus Woesearchaeota archaeon]